MSRRFFLGWHFFFFGSTPLLGLHAAAALANLPLSMSGSPSNLPCKKNKAGMRDAESPF